MPLNVLEEAAGAVTVPALLLVASGWIDIVVPFIIWKRNSERQSVVLAVLLV